VSDNIFNKSKSDREASAKKEFQKNMRGTGTRITFIEHKSASGIPDCNACFAGAEWWIEFKAPVAPKRDNTPLFGSNHGLTAQQEAFMRSQVRAGGNCALYVRLPNKTIIIVDGVDIESAEPGIINKWPLTKFSENGFLYSANDSFTWRMINHLFKSRSTGLK